MVESDGLYEQFLQELQLGYPLEVAWQSLKELAPMGMAGLSLDNFLENVSVYLDQLMLGELESTLRPERVRERIAVAVSVRLKVMEPYKRAISQLIRYGAAPHKMPLAMRGIWKTCDHIWYWAGDTATDFNYYSKRGLLAVVLSSTLVFWMKDGSEEAVNTAAFVDRSIDRIMKIPQITKKIKETAACIPLVGRIFR